VAAQKRSEVNSGGTSGGGSLVMELREAAIFKPDLKQMTAFRPSCESGVGMNAIPGGCYPVPSELNHLLSQLPPPSCFQVSHHSKQAIAIATTQGPFVQIDELMHLLNTSRVSDDIESRRGKRRRESGGESDEDLTSGGAPPINDIYRSRQQKRANISLP